MCQKRSYKRKSDIYTPQYIKYSGKQKKLTKHNETGILFPDLPDKKYEIIYADPPWDYGGNIQFDRTMKRKDDELNISSASFVYPTMSIDDLKKLDVKSIADVNCLLFMWSSSPHLEKAIDLGKSWGFEYKTVAFVWDKMSHNPGYYTLSNCEICLVFKKGKIPTPRGARNIQQLVRSPRQEHSSKPEIVRDNIVKMFPTQKRIELFSRGEFDGWDVWGLDVIKDDMNEPLF